MNELSPRSDAGILFVLENQDTHEMTEVKDAITVGRGADRDLVLDCVKCSRFHAEFRMDDEELWVEDQGSTNGSFVNGEQINSRTPLAHGDLAQFGKARFRIIDLRRQPAGEGGQKTVVAGPSYLRGLLVGDQGELADSQKASGQDSSAASGSRAPDSDDTADRSSESSDPGGRGSETGENESEPQLREAAPRAGKSTGSIDAPIPRSWADAEQLEQTSHTSMMARPQTTGPNVSSLDPNMAIAEAWRHVSGKHPILVGLKAPVTGVAFELPSDDGKTKWEIGRGKGADIEIDADSVSGRHCQLVLTNGRWKIVNMMSVNGTFVNGRKVLSAYLKPGDVIRIGEVKLVFHAKGGQSLASGKSGGGGWLTAPFRWLSGLFSRGNR